MNIYGSRVRAALFGAGARCARGYSISARLPVRAISGRGSAKDEDEDGLDAV